MINQEDDYQKHSLNNNLLRNGNNKHLGKTNSNSEISIPSSSSSDIATAKVNSFRERRMNGVNNSIIEIELDPYAKKEYDIMSKKISLVEFYGGKKGKSGKGKSSNSRRSSSSDDYSYSSKSSSTKNHYASTSSSASSSSDETDEKKEQQSSSSSKDELNIFEYDFNLIFEKIPNNDSSSNNDNNLNNEVASPSPSSSKKNDITLSPTKSPIMNTEYPSSTPSSNRNNISNIAGINANNQVASTSKTGQRIALSSIVAVLITIGLFFSALCYHRKRKNKQQSWKYYENERETFDDDHEDDDEDDDVDFESISKLNRTYGVVESMSVGGAGFELMATKDTVVF